MLFESGDDSIADSSVHIEFAGQGHAPVSLVPRVADHGNLVVLRTFSKWAGLAGLRAGYGVMPEALASLLMTIKQPYNLNVAAADAMLASLEDAPLLLERCCRMAGTRERLFTLLDAVEWIQPYPSQANFVLARAGDRADALRAALLKSGILVRDGAGIGFPGHLRIAIGTAEDNTRLLEVWDRTVDGGR